MNSFVKTLMSICLISVLLCVACGKDKPLEGFYMPDIASGEKKVLVYESTSILKNKQFWLVERTNDGYLVSVFDDRGRLMQRSKDMVTPKGIVQKEAEIQWRDSSGRNIIYVNPEISQGGLFPFVPKDSLHAYVYCMNWRANGQYFELCKNRRYMGQKQIKLGGEVLDCAAFLTSEVYGDEKEGFLELRTDGVEFYAENRGLVLKRKFVTSILNSGQKQINILDLESFSELYPEINLNS